MLTLFAQLVCHTTKKYPASRTCVMSYQPVYCFPLQLARMPSEVNVQRRHKERREKFCHQSKILMQHQYQIPSPAPKPRKKAIAHACILPHSAARTTYINPLQSKYKNVSIQRAVTASFINEPCRSTWAIPLRILTRFQLKTALHYCTSHTDHIKITFYTLLYAPIRLAALIWATEQ